MGLGMMPGLISGLHFDPIFVPHTPVMIPVTRVRIHPPKRKGEIVDAKQHVQSA